MTASVPGISGRTIVITGASSGIGEAAARQLAAAGAVLCLVARRADELQRVRDAIRSAGGQAECYPADLNNGAALDAVCAEILARHTRVDVLVNNAGRSIRRALADSVGRPHDFERTIQLNYLAAVRMTLNLLPRFLEQGSGHVINVSSVAALMSTPRFAAYLASKSALDAFSRSLAIELHDQGLRVTTLNYPLVKTPMIEPTAIYRYLPQMEVSEAAGWIVQAVRDQPVRRTTSLALVFNLATAVLPGPALRLLAGFYRRRNRKLLQQLEAEKDRSDTQP